MNKIENELINNSFNDNELKIIIDSYHTHNIEIGSTLNYNDYTKVNKQLNLKLNNECTNQYFSFDECATNIIDKLFAEYVDDDTLIITSKQEHPKVNNILARYPNKYYLVDAGSLIESDYFALTAKFNQFKRVFVYLIGTICGTGQIVKQNLFRTIKHILSKSIIPHIFVLDAVQEMFILPRDYSIFDYVIGTAHAIIPEYDMGIVISKDKPYSKMLKCANTFSTLLDIILKRKQYLTTFSVNLSERYSSYAQKFNLTCNNNSGHIFSIGDQLGTLLPIIPSYQQYFKTDSHVIVDQSRVMKNVLFRGCWSLFEQIFNYNIQHNIGLHLDDDMHFLDLLHTTDNFLANLV